jgi:uncharacterized protein (TIGR02246 family)
MPETDADASIGEFLQLLRAEREIGRLITRFARCFDTKDFTGYAACYARDGVLTTPWGSHHGRDGLVEYVERDLGHFVATQHVSAGHEIEVDDDHATARFTLLASHVTRKDGERDDERMSSRERSRCTRRPQKEI